MTITTAPVTLPPITSPERTAFLCQRMVSTVSTALGTPPDDPRVRGAITDVVQFFLAAGGRAEVAAQDAQRVVRSLAVEPERGRPGGPGPGPPVPLAARRGDEHPRAGRGRGAAGRGHHGPAPRRPAVPAPGLRDDDHRACAARVPVGTTAARSGWPRWGRRATPGSTPPARAGSAPWCRSTASLPEVLRSDPRLIARTSAYELLVPEDVDPHSLASAVAGQVVVGPLTPWSDLGDSLQSAVARGPSAQ
ncbi:hypothetical protein G5V59_04605 [Nocardioides sp. W3-2-3]|uniref:hypothetical protein n=1 Tax=Nocardioides convexus TaxID=2712224 RepID=UPI0024185FC1|nr:hypothetical protein [Nocardioides convexus]NGZ99834.1 hypothetical protein [Nocardioides convexus]